MDSFKEIWVWRGIRIDGGLFITKVSSDLKVADIDLTYRMIVQ